jgi:hypothetical protein
VVSDAVPPVGLICADDAAGGAMAGELAAMAAAAIASGAVLLPDAVTPVVAVLAGAVEGTFVGARMTGITTAIAFGTTAVPACCAARVGSVVELSSEDDLSVDFAVPSFGPLAVALDCWAALALEA